MIDRLGSTLLHFLWEGAAIAIVYTAARFLSRRAASNVRYLVACTALAAMLAAPVLTWIALAPTAVEWTPAAIARWAAAPPYSPTAPIQILSAPPAPARYFPWIVAAWLAGAAALSLRLLGGCVFAARLRSHGTRPAPAEWQAAFHRLRADLGITVPVPLLESAAAEVPTVVGWLRPVILIPAAALAGLPPDQLEAILLHELAHIRRHDPLVNLLQSVAETLLFYHPAVWWISGHIRAEREHCCDDLAVAATGDVVTYARALAALASARARRFTPALAATDGSLSSRIARLLGQPRAGSSPAPLAVVALLVVAAAAAFAQTASAPQFAVAAVKPSAERNFMAVRALPGGRLIASAPLKLIIQNAYSLQDYQIVGGPSWIDSERFAIDAKAEGNPSREKLLEMLQPLLADRFHLQVHRETRQLGAFVLAVSKGGPKLAAAKEGSCATITPTAGPPAPGQPFPCGHLGIMGQPSGVRMRGGQIGMPELVRVLSMIVARPVVDHTGLAGSYDIDFEFVPDSIAAGLNHQVKAGASAPSPDAPGANETGPSIVTALQEQLGLKLESGKAGVEVLVIDHVERPGAN